ASAFSLVFAGFVIAALAWRTFLALRQSRHVARHRDQVPADFAALIPLDAHRRAADYTLEKQRVGLAETWVVDGAVLFALTLGGGVAAIDAASARVLGSGHARDLATVFGVMLVSALASLPFDAWRTFGVETRYGFNRTTPALFLADLLRGAALAAALGTPLLLLVFWFVQKTGTFWWFYTGLAWIAFTLVLVTIFPRWIAPLFNRFTPLEQGELRSRIESLVARCGF